MTEQLKNILTYSDNLIKIQKNVWRVLEKLRKAGLQLKAEKCEFYQTEVTDLGLTAWNDEM